MIERRQLLSCVAVWASAVFSGQSLWAGATGVTVLTAVANGTEQDFTVDDLKALGRTEITTATIWTEGEQVFAGVLLEDLMDHLGVTGGTLQASAVNDYTVDIPLTEVDANGPIVAYERNGAPMSVRDKGPLWVVYPFDSGPEYQSEVIYARSIWQLVRIAVKD